MFIGQISINVFSDTLLIATKAFNAAISLCKAQPSHQPVFLASLYVELGTNFSMNESYKEAESAFLEAAQYLRDHLISIMTANNQTNGLSSDKLLLQPSAFDTAEIKFVRAQFAEVLLKCQDLNDSLECDNLAALKVQQEQLTVAKEGEVFQQIEDSSKFTDITHKIKIGQKRTYQQSVASDRQDLVEESLEDQLKKKKSE